MEDINRTEYIIQLNELDKEVNDNYKKLKNLVEDLSILSRVVELYPEGEYKNRASGRFNKYKNKMVKVLEEYEATRYKYMKYLEDNKEHFSNYINYSRQYPEALYCIENLYRDFYKSI